MLSTTLFRLQRDGQRHSFTSAIALSHPFSTPISITNNLAYTTLASAPTHHLFHGTLSDRGPTPSTSTFRALLPRFPASDGPCNRHTMIPSVLCPPLSDPLCTDRIPVPHRNNLFRNALTPAPMSRSQRSSSPFSRAQLTVVPLTHVSPPLVFRRPFHR